MYLKTLLLGIIFSNVACAQKFSATINKADWEISQGHSSCQLIQQIPFYGSAVFSHRTGQSLRLSVTENRYKQDIIKASLFVDNPAWVHQATPNKNYLVSLESKKNGNNYPQLSVYGDTAETMLDALSKGQSPTFFYARTAIGGLSEDDHITISPINFTKKYQQFIDCRKDFLPDGFKEQLEKTIFFKSGTRQLNTAVQKQLKNTAEYIKQIKEGDIVIVSETKIAGKKDKKWFLKRANSIVAKLNKLGIPKNKVSIKKAFKHSNKHNKTVRLGIFGPDALKTIYYRKGNTQLTQTEKKRLDALAYYAHEFLPSQQMVIKSHTDSKGSRAHNLKVSQKRGEVIRQYLISQGMDESRVRVKAYGESKPVRINRFETGRAQNRRVTIDFV